MVALGMIKLLPKESLSNLGVREREEISILCYLNTTAARLIWAQCKPWHKLSPCNPYINKSLGKLRILINKFNSITQLGTILPGHNTNL